MTLVRQKESTTKTKKKKKESQERISTSRERETRNDGTDGTERMTTARVRQHTQHDDGEYTTRVSLSLCDEGEQGCKEGSIDAAVAPSSLCLSSLAKPLSLSLHAIAAADTWITQAIMSLRLGKSARNQSLRESTDRRASEGERRNGKALQ